MLFDEGLEINLQWSIHIINSVGTTNFFLLYPTDAAPQFLLKPTPLTYLAFECFYTRIPQEFGARS